MKNIFRISGIILLIILIHSCKKEEIPTLTTAEITSITVASAKSGGVITYDGGAIVSERGVCWSTNINPTINDNKTSDGAGEGSFTSDINNLNGGTTYYLRAYSTNSAGTGYGNELSFTTGILTTIPTVTTTSVVSMPGTTATSGGNVTSDGGKTILVRGVCWSTSTNPTILDNKTQDGTGTGTFTSLITELTSPTTYSNLTYGTVTDIDGNIYKTVTIGSQVWMAENLKTTKYRNGDLIGTTTPATLDISNESTPKYQWVSGGYEGNVASYGRLYTWYAVTDSRNVCPTGWHLPSDAEWNTLITNLGGESVAGAKMKESSTAHWYSPNTGATNEAGFTALPSGFRSYRGPFGNIGKYGYWWSSNASSGSTWDFGIRSDRISIGNYGLTMKHGISVRCIKD